MCNSTCRLRKSAARSPSGLLKSPSDDSSTLSRARHPRMCTRSPSWRGRRAAAFYQAGDTAARPLLPVQVVEDVLKFRSLSADELFSCNRLGKSIPLKSREDGLVT
jgi:hypothetical protein